MIGRGRIYTVGRGSDSVTATPATGHRSPITGHRSPATSRRLPSGRRAFHRRRERLRYDRRIRRRRDGARPAR
ncbi:hypothetical protein DVK02_07140 [Halobellus sp. Atlit-31R]|nr:hypothetical protein DVK02_07140 [Halobellus sp. Atlit-31R]